MGMDNEGQTVRGQWDFPFEREAAQNLPPPEGLSLADLMAYSGLRNIYRAFRAGDTKTELDGKISAVYKPGGSVAFADLPAADEAHLGMVYNITDKFTSTAGFVEGAGTKHPAGTNVAVVKVGEEFKYDALAGFVDLSGYQLKEEGKVLSSNDFTDEEKAKLGAVGYATDEEVDAMLAEVFGAGTENT